jgi:hypothetical protein
MRFFMSIYVPKHANDTAPRAELGAERGGLFSRMLNKLQFSTGQGKRGSGWTNFGMSKRYEGGSHRNVSGKASFNW